ncbi:MAG: hypothetical protein HYZ45_12505, partial [Burkholderiales bacterium]|nr:hypothetical protein [Burkholderiales bacterium]
MVACGIVSWIKLRHTLCACAIRWRHAYSLCLVLALWIGISSPTFANPTPNQSNRDTKRWSQLADLVFQNLGVEQGLPNENVTALLEDANGFIWIGTHRGLARWDGYSFRAYPADPKNEYSLGDDSISALHLDQRGQVWVGTIRGALARYDAQNDRFIRIGVAISGGANGVSHDIIYAITDDGKGGIWVGTEGGLDHIEANGNIQHFQHDANDSKSLPADRIMSLMLDPVGRLWVGTAQGLAVRQGNGNQFTQIALATENDGPQPNIRCLRRTSDGKIWVGTEQDGLFVIDANSTLPTTATPALVEIDEQGVARKNGFSHRPVYSIFEMNANEVWVGTFGDGLAIINRSSMKSHRILQNPTQPNSLANNNIISIVRDRSGQIWICTNRGISRFDSTQNAILTLFGYPNRAG